jgi:hypothetical protein
MNVTQAVLDAGDEISKELHGEIVALGPDAIEPLLDFIRDEKWSDADGPGGGWAPIHAAQLLADLKAVQAIEPMLEALGDTVAGEDRLFDALMVSLAEIGQPVLEPALRIYAAEDDPAMRTHLAALLSEIGVRDERIYQALLELLKNEAGLGASSLGIYGDERALEPLSRALDALEPDRGDNQDVIELTSAIEELGGVLTPGQRAKAEAVEKDWKRVFAQRRLRDTGRNEACPCGSGKKYKKCHLQQDESA